ncbi:ATP-binding cassette domain-containing protein [Paenibacillus gorillae]|uniref:ATP-binding cassette domain-containing protein n=1 Tax=Paenibacillus gorillae TaxID=1243662 RepID=UPI0005A76FBF|nr:ATP-binding cassette domain-containing protein [Paenibacillus gorillae]
MGITVVSISGPSGSGKSSLVNTIVTLLPNSTSIHFDDYKETTKFPEDLSQWLNAGCNPNDFETPKMIEDLKALQEQSHYNWVIVEEPFGRGRTEIAGLIDYVVCIDIPSDIALARSIKRAALNVPEGIETSILLGSIIEFIDQYLQVSRDSYVIVNENVKKDCNLIVDGTKEVGLLANEIITAIQIPTDTK